MNSLFFKGSFVFGCKNINIILKYNAMFIIFLKKISFTQTVKLILVSWYLILLVMFANVKKKIQQAKQNPVSLLCFSDTYPERHASDSMEGLLTLTVQHELLFLPSLRQVSEPEHRITGHTLVDQTVCVGGLPAQ